MQRMRGLPDTMLVWFAQKSSNCLRKCQNRAGSLKNQKDFIIQFYFYQRYTTLVKQLTFHYYVEKNHNIMIK